MGFNLTKIDQDLINKELAIKLEAVTDVGKLVNGSATIPFQFPPIIKSDSKSAKWETLLNVPGYEPAYMYTGANPRKISIQATYIVGGPSGGSKAQWSTRDVVSVLRLWKAYFYFATNGGGGGGIGAGDTLPVYNIKWGSLLEGSPNSQWRGINYNIKQSDVWIKDSVGSMPLISEITIELELVTQVDVTGGKKDEGLRPHSNLVQFAPKEWY